MPALTIRFALRRLIDASNTTCSFARITNDVHRPFLSVRLHSASSNFRPNSTFTCASYPASKHSATSAAGAEFDFRLRARHLDFGADSNSPAVYAQAAGSIWLNPQNDLGYRQAVALSQRARFTGDRWRIIWSSGRISDGIHGMANVFWAWSICTLFERVSVCRRPVHSALGHRAVSQPVLCEWRTEGVRRR